MIPKKTQKQKSFGRAVSDDGFTLIEILIAMAITSIGLMGTAVLIMGISSSNLASSEVTIATTLVHDKLEYIRNRGYDSAPAVGAANEDSGYNAISGYPSFRRVTSSAVVGTYNTDKIKSVSVTVYWRDNNRSISLTTLITR